MPVVGILLPVAMVGQIVLQVSEASVTEVLLLYGAAIVVTLPLILGVVRRVGDGWETTFGKYLGLSVLGLVVLGVVIQAALGAAGGQAFALAGAARRIVLPIAYVLLGGALLIRSDRVRLPAGAVFLWLVGGSAFISTVFSIPLVGSSVTIDALVQGTLLIGGFIVVFAAALRSPLKNHDLRRIIIALILGGAAAAVLARSSAPFSVLLVPAGAAAIALAADRGRTGRHWLLLVGVGLLAYSAFDIFLGPRDPSVGRAAQILVCAAVGIGLIPSRLVRGWGLTISGVVGLIVVFREGLIAVFAPSFVSEDVTLQQRAFEARTVLATTGRTVLTSLFGLGPGGTVDLSGAPDANTLISAGRVLSAVDDVHLLPFWLIHKMGWVGLALTLLALVWLVILTGRVLLARSVLPYDVALLMFVWAGVADAIPAASGFFSNLLIPLAWGMVAARDVERRRNGTASPSTNLSSGLEADETRVQPNLDRRGI